MPELDLIRVERDRRVRIDEQIAADSPVWAETGLRFEGPVEVHLEAQKSGADVIVRGRFHARVETECRRCLVRVHVDVDEPVSLVFRSGLGRAEAEREEAYPLPAGERLLDLGEPLREHVLLAVPQYALCRETCRGLCPRCGTNLNEGECSCGPAGGDERWAALRRVKFD